MDPKSYADHGENGPKMFSSFLTNIGYHDSNMREEAQYSDWMFADPQMAELLMWIFQHINLSNIVYKDQQARYDQLAAAGKALDEAALNKLKTSDTTLGAAVDVPETEEEIQAIVTLLNSKIEQLKLSTKHLNQMSESMRQQSDRLTEKPVGIDETEQLEEKLNRQKNNCFTAYSEFDSSVMEMYKHTSMLTKLLSTTEDNSCTLLSHTDLKEYFEAERQYTDSIKTFAERKFTQSSIVNDDDDTEYQLINAADPLTFSKSNVENVEKLSQEVVHLQQAHALSSTRKLKLESEEVRLDTEIDVLKTTDINRTHNLTEKQLQAQIAEYEEKLVLQDQELSSLDNKLHHLIEQESLSKETLILSGDYDEKIKRQNYFLQIQDQIIRWCIDQRSRIELLTLLYKAEYDDLYELYSLYTAFIQYIQQLEQSILQRQTLLEELKANVGRYDRNIIDRSDVHYQTLSKILEPHVEESAVKYSRLLCTYSQLNDNVASLKHILNTDTDTKRNVNAELSILVKDMKKTISQALKSTLPGFPGVDCLTSELVRDELVQAQTMKDKLHKEMVGVMTLVKKKRKTMKN